MIKAVLFDFFGVLYPDTFWGLANLYLQERDAAAQQKLHELVRKADLNVIDQQEFWREAAELFGVDLQQLEKDRDAFGGVDKVLLNRIRKLKKQGIKIGMISNVGSGMVRGELGKDAELFDALILSGDTGFVKPDAQVYELATDRLQLEPEECVFFDDIPRNVRGAQMVGMKAYLYDGIHSYDAAMSALMSDVND